MSRSRNHETQSIARPGSVRARVLWILLALGGAVALADPVQTDGSDAAATSAPASDAYAMLPFLGDSEGPEQPIPFSHAQHAGEFGLPCTTCHAPGGPTSLVGSGASLQDVALPSTAVCMQCHNAVATDRAAIVSLTDYHRNGKAVPWQRVYEVLTGVNWSHQPHLQANVDCATCHGDVRSLEVMSVTTSVTAMGSCISCHQASGADSDCQTCHAWPTDATFETTLTDR